MKELKIKKIDKEFVEQNSDFEGYALVYSKNIRKIYCDTELGQSADPIDDEIYYSKMVDNYVCIENKEKGKKIYRKCRGRNGISSDEISLGYRSMKELSCDIGDKISISPCSWLRYHGWNSNKNERCQFWSILISLVLAIISGITSILSLLIDLPILH